MKTYTFSQARQNLAAVLNESRREDVLIKRRGGEVFRVSVSRAAGSPFDVPGITVKATTRDVLRAIRTSRAG